MCCTEKKQSLLTKYYKIMNFLWILSTRSKAVKSQLFKIIIMNLGFAFEAFTRHIHDMKNIITIATIISQVTLMAQNIDVYFGTYTRKSDSKGIYHATFDLNSGKIKDLQLAARSANPSFIVIHPSGKFLYSVAKGKPGRVKAFSIDPKSKKLKLLNEQSSEGITPCHLSLDIDGKNLLAANYSSGNATVFPIKDDGSLKSASSVVQHQGSSITRRQKGPHAHSINLSKDNRFAFVADLGIDKVMVYKFDPKTGKLIPNKPGFVKIKPGAGPRHFTFHPNGKYAYVINELDNTITAFSYNVKTGVLTEIQNISSLPKDFTEISYCAEVAIHPNGKFLYGSNRGHDSIVVFQVTADGKLQLIGFQNKGIDNPRHFNFTPDGKWCLVGNQDANTVVVFKVNSKTGQLVPTGHSINIGKPICIQFMK